MAKLVRLHDPGDTDRRVTTVLKHDQVPEALEFLASLPYGTENAFIRGLIQQWVLAHKDSPTLDDEITAVLNGPGGRYTTTPASWTRPLVREKRKPSPRRVLAPAPRAPAVPAPVAQPMPETAAAQRPLAPPAPIESHPTATAALATLEAPMVMPVVPAEVSVVGQAEEEDFFAGLDKL